MELYYDSHRVKKFAYKVHIMHSANTISSTLTVTSQDYLRPSDARPKASHCSHALHIIKSLHDTKMGPTLLALKRNKTTLGQGGTHFLT